MLITMLTTSTCTGIPFDRKVFLVECDGLGFEWFNNRYGNGTRVNTTFTFGWRNTLNAMTTGFVTEGC